MQSITQLVADSLTRHNFHLPVDPARLQWSPWFRCHSAASLLAIPSQPGIVALAEEITSLEKARKDHDPQLRQTASVEVVREGHEFTRAVKPFIKEPALAAEASPRVLALFQFTPSDSMAYTLDRLFTQPSPLRPRLASGRCHLRYVVLENESERRNIAATLNQWLLHSTQKSATTPADFSFFDSMLDSVKDQPQSGERLQPTA